MWKFSRGCGAAGLALLGALSAQAEITSITGSATARVTETVSGTQTQFDEATDSFPQTSALPVQVVARLEAAEPNNAAASVAAQFADPATSMTANPEEFAINLALLSETGAAYACEAIASESRKVIFTTAEFPDLQDGDPVTITGRLFLDGALVIFSPAVGKDLTGAAVTLSVNITPSGAGTGGGFSGSLKLTGGANASVDFSATGAFPTGPILRADLAVLNPDFGVFEVAVLPFVEFDYEITAIIGQEFTLDAEVRVDASNGPDMVGVAAVLGTPVEAILQTITLVEDDAVAAKFTAALQSEREDPTGTPAFRNTAIPFNFCGILGFESLVGLASLGFLSARQRAGQRRRR